MSSGFLVARYGIMGVGGAILGSIAEAITGNIFVEYAAAGIGGELAAILSTGGLEMIALMGGTRLFLTMEAPNVASGMAGNYLRHMI